MLMKIDRGLALVLGGVLAAAACAPAAGTGAAAGPRIMVPVPNVTCASGPLTTFALADSAASSMGLVATLADSAQGAAYGTALAQARRAVEAQPGNAYAHYLAGQAAIGTRDYAAAATSLARAEQICPELGAYDIDRLQAAGAGNAFNAATGLLQAGDTTAALSTLETALALDPNTYPAEFYLGLINFQRQNTPEAVTRWRRVLQLLETLPADTSAAENQQRLDVRGNVVNAMVLAGVQYLQREQNEPAVPLLQELTRMVPNSADAWYHLALAQYNLERWNDLVASGQRAVEVAPLSYGAWVLYYNAYAGQAQAASEANQTARANELSRQATQVRTRTENLPVRIEGLSIDTGDEATAISGTAVGTGRTAPVTVEFTLYGVQGTLGTGQVTITPPANGQRAPFNLSIANTRPITGYSYRVVGQ
jgi:tetratricopeptide (TPR) repeat protein